jgi:uncharacterized protein YndB with AHSA1/START domain
MNTQTIQIAPVRKSIIVAAAQAHAFDVFVNRIDRWWPKSHNIGEGTPLKITIEPREGGRWYSSHENGSEAVNGHVLAWDPPNRLVLSWEISAQWKSDSRMRSEIELTFTAEGSKSTRVELLHHKFETMGAEDGKAMRDTVDGPMGWSGLLETFKKEAEA